MSDDAAHNENLINLTADIVAAHVSNNKVEIADMSRLIGSVYTALVGVGAEKPTEALAPVPAVSIRASVKPDYIVCLEDGKKLKLLRRYIRTHYDLSPEEYREKWGLPADYPMVAPAYAEKRSELAKELGLGRQKGSKRGGRKKLSISV